MSINAFRDALAGFLPPERMERILCLDSVGSTNDHLRALAQHGAPGGTAVIADQQTLGKGRVGRSFASPGGKGIYMSLLLRPSVPPERSFTLTPCAAVALAGAVEEVIGEEVGVKWVNDLVLRGKKICGILTEMSLTPGGETDFIILGAGLNVSTEESDFPPEVRATAGSLFTQTGRRFDRAALAAGMVKALDALGEGWLTGQAAYRAAYARRCVTLGRDVTVIAGDGSYTAFAEGIDEDFALLVRRPDGSREAVSTGEVSVRGLYGYV